MPFSGDSYSVPAASRDDATPNTVITSADYKLLLDDLETALNTTTSIGRGGTGATTQAGARTAMGLGTISTQAANSVDIDGGAIDGTVIGGATPAAGAFTTATFTERPTILNSFPGIEFTDTDGGLARISCNNGDVDIWADTDNTQSDSSVRFRVDGNIVARFDESGHLRAGDSASPTVTAEFAGTDAILLTVGTEAQRPAGVKGYLRFNEDTDEPEYYDGSAWQDFGNDWTELAVTATTSGTAIDFTSLPSGIKEIEIWFDRVETSGASDFLIQIGTGGGPTTTGYSSGSGTAGSTSRTGSTSGFAVFKNNVAHVSSGLVGLYQINTNDWSSSHSLSMNPSSGTSVAGGGGVTLAGAVDNIRITTIDGSQTFTAGQLRVRYR